ncbi:uncharacterized protein [Centruroides vittatus]|uniref:uncharacterized protein n=1 Tax=Centruroides vittatus TaxID=120091 RepID=UPI003510A408
MAYRILKMKFVFCTLVYLVSPVTRCSALSLSYLRTAGQTQDVEDGIRAPERTEVLACLGVCERTPTCMCVRISTNGEGLCQSLNSTVDINGQDKTGYVYFAQALYKDTIDKESQALNKPAHQSSIYVLNNVRYTADRAVDGNRNIDGFQAPYFAHTQDGDNADTFPWWQVDLEEEYIVTGVNILNRRKWSERLHDFEVRVGNTRLSNAYSNKHFDLNPLCAKHEGAGVGDGGLARLVCQPCPTRGRYLSIQIVKPCDTCEEASKNVLQLAEVDVFGVKAE